MRVNIEKIPDEGLRLEEPLTLDWLNTHINDAEDTGYVGAAEGLMALLVERAGDNVRIRGDIAAPLTTHCDRCLEATPFVSRSHVDLSLVSETALGEFGIEKELMPDDLGLGTHNGESIDVDTIVREQILLTLPMCALCTPDCKGLCPVCGQNQNRTVCDCHEARFDPRWEKLKSLKLQ